jgi:hypothetical protein
MNAPFTRPSVESDARTRAFRTFVQGLAVDVLAAAGVAVAAAISGGISWTQTYWVTFGLALGKSVVTAGLSYIARKVVPPAPPTTRGDAS